MGGGQGGGEALKALGRLLLWDKAGAGAFFVAASVFAAVACSLWTADPDVFWHLAVGKWIAENGAVPRADVYSWSAAGRPWTAHQWLWELALWVAFRLGGAVGIWTLAGAAVFAGCLVLRAGLAAAGAREEIAWLAAGLAPVMLLGWIKPWPQAGVYGLFCVYLWLSLRGKWTARDAFLAGGLAALWANVHSSAVLLPCLLAAEGVWEGLHRRPAGGRFLASACAAAGLLANPHGAGLIIYAVREGLLTGTYRRHIAEWMPFYFGSPELAVSFFGCALIFLAAAAAGRWQTAEFVRAAGLWALALLSRIWTPYAVLATCALLGGLSFRFRPFKAAAALAAGMAVLVLAVRGVPPDLDAAAARNRYPVAAVRVLRSAGIERPFNDYGFGGYLLWRGIPIYLDGRADLYRGGVLERYLRAPEEEDDLAGYVASTGADGAVVVRRGPYDRALAASPWWERVYADEAAAVYRRRGP
ncbi:MAG: hypothetical protein ACPLRW_07385 [Moorellales bacterium]